MSVLVEESEALLGGNEQQSASYAALRLVIGDVAGLAALYRVEGAELQLGTSAVHAQVDCGGSLVLVVVDKRYWFNTPVLPTVDALWTRLGALAPVDRVASVELAPGTPLPGGLFFLDQLQQVLLCTLFCLSVPGEVPCSEPARHCCQV